MNIRTATLNDLDAVTAVEAACFPAAEAASGEEFAEMGIIPAGAYRNLDYVKSRLTVAESVQQARVDLISDPQTSGGLLVALPMEDAGALLAALRERDPDSAIIGAVVAQTEHTLEIV